MQQLKNCQNTLIINKLQWSDRSILNEGGFQWGFLTMSIRVDQSYIHWNYFIALESDLAQVSRYIEFNTKNFRTYSIELAHLLLATSSEVDVIAKGICKYLDPATRAENIFDYRTIIKQNLPEFAKETTYIPRFDLTLRPWSNWIRNKSPLWWQSYNNVKHERSEHFQDANLKNVLNSMGGLLIAVFYFYKLQFINEGEHIQSNRDVTRKLGSGLDFLKLRDDYYYGYLLLE